MIRSIQSRLETAGIPYHAVQVFGRVNINIHIKCLGRDTAQQWANLLAQAFKAAPKISPWSWDATINQGTSLRPTKVDGYLVTIIQRNQS